MKIPPRLDHILIDDVDMMMLCVCTVPGDIILRLRLFTVTVLRDCCCSALLDLCFLTIILPSLNHQ